MRSAIWCGDVCDQKLLMDEKIDGFFVLQFITPHEQIKPHSF